MGLFDSIVNTVGGALGQSKDPAAGDGEGAQNILGNLLKQGGLGQSGNIIGQLLGGLGGGATQEGQAGQGGGPLGGILETLASSGLGEQVSSWVSNNPNLPVSMDQIRDALGSEQVQQMAAASGLPIGDFLKNLAEHLPHAASEAAGVPASGEPT